MQHYDYLDMLIRRAAEALRAVLGKEAHPETEALQAARRWVSGRGPEVLAGLPEAVVLGLISLESDPQAHGIALAEQAALAESEGLPTAPALWRHAAAVLERVPQADQSLQRLIRDRIE